MMVKTYRIRRSMFVGGVLFLCATVALMISAVVLLGFFETTLLNRWAVALGCGAVLSPFVGLSLWIIAGSLRESLTVFVDRVEFTGIFKSKTIRVSDVTDARWISDWQSSLKLITPAASQWIWFRNYRPKERQELIRHFRRTLSLDIQEHWGPELEQQMADPLQESFWRNRYLLLFVIVFGSFNLRDLGAALSDAPPTNWTGFPLLDWSIRLLVALVLWIAVVWGSCRLIRWIENDDEMDDTRVSIQPRGIQEPQMDADGRK